MGFIDNATMIQAVKKAMDSELRAIEYFEKAMERTADPGAKKMFKLLIKAKRQNFTFLDVALKSIDGGELGDATRARFAMIRPKTEPVKLTDLQIKNDIDALEVGIQSQRELRKAFLEMAFLATNPMVADFFNGLANEEKYHLDLMEKQYVSIKENGQWSW